MKGKAAEAFEELHIYQRARELTNAVYRLTRIGAFAGDRGLVDQIRRAAVSIMSNVAEGFERGSTVEFVQFLYIAKGSCGEVRAQLQIARDQEYLPEKEHSHLQGLCRRIGGMISNFIAHLQNSDYRGEKTTRPQRRTVAAQQKRMDALRAAQLTNINAAKERAKHEQNPDVSSFEELYGQDGLTSPD
ncbi:MAG: four helix bundle protein [Pirellulales bacterium]|nr:four helix bundle protein [Pirellulales bacterium]